MEGYHGLEKHVQTSKMNFISVNLKRIDIILSFLNSFLLNYLSLMNTRQPVHKYKDNNKG